MDENQQLGNFSNMSVADEFIAFIEPEGGKKRSEQMLMAYELCKERSSASWLTLDESTKINKKIIFVCQEFSGSDFQKLRSLKARVFGPQYVIEYLKKDECIPVTLYPIYTATMRDLRICCSSLSQELREDIHRKIQLMGGTVHRQFTIACTHLVAGEVGSKKYHVACRYNVPVMLPEWVHECWEVGKEAVVHATDKRFNKFHCPIFKGLHITVSQVDATDRRKIQDLVQSNGGTYSGDLRASATTHLILLEPNGSKYKVAKQKSIHCVKPSWLYESVEKGFCVDADLHRIETNSHSTTTLSSTMQDGSNVSLPDFSSVSAISCQSGINETTLSRETTIFNPGGITAINTPLKSNLKESELLQKLENCNYHSAGLFLDGCKIIVSGFTSDVTEKLRKILNSGGATRFDQICDAVSHVIQGDDVDELRNTLQNGLYRPHVVDIEWLFACVSAGRPVDEMKYHCLDFHSKGETVSPFSNSSKISLNNSKSQTKCLPDKSVSRELQLEDLDVMSQYMTNIQAETVEDKLFSNLSFLVCGFNEVDTEEIKILIVDNGGKFYVSSIDQEVNYAVVPVQGFPIPNHCDNLVTNLWVVTCIEMEALQDVAAHPLYRPVPVNTKSQPLKGCVLSLSQFSHLERDCLIKIATLLGAKYQEYFSRHNHEARGLLASTHLIAIQPEGSKYLGALKWGLPAVTMHWLLKCAELGCKLEEEAFIVGNTEPNGECKSAFKENLNVSLASRDDDQLKTLGNQTESLLKTDNTKMEDGPKSPWKINTFRTPTSVKGYPSTSEKLQQIQERLRTGYQTPSLHLVRVKQLMLEECDKSADTSSDSLGTDTPTKFLDPNVNFKPQINIRDVMAALDSPLAKTTMADNTSLSNLPIEDLFALRVKQALKHQMKSSDVVAPKDSDDSMEEDVVNKAPLLGVVIVVSKKLCQRQSELNKIAEELGAKYRWKYDRSCTHFIHEGKSSDLNKEMKHAKEEGKMIVSPEWLYACKEKQMHVEEHLYPYTYNPQLQLNVMLIKGASPTKNNIGENSPKKSFSSSASLMGSNSSNCSDGKEMQSKDSKLVDEIREDACRKLDELLAATKVAKNRRKSRIGSCNSIVNSSAEGLCRKPLLRPRPGKQETANKMLDEPYESVPITWDDPTSRLERQKLAAVLAKDSQSVDLHFTDEVTTERIINDDDSNKEKFTEDERDSETSDCHQSLPRIMLAGFQAQQRHEYGNIVTKLGGILLNSEQFDPSCTHLIVGNPSRSEKYLASLASGKWILEMSYVKASENATHFVEETDFEWGREENAHLTNISEQHLKLAKAAHRWRINLQQKRAKLGKELHSTVGAFQNWKAIVYSNEVRSGSFKRVLQAGGAEISDAMPPFSDAMGVTHAFLELSYVKSPNVDLSALLDAGVICIKPEYIGHFLIEGQASSISNFYIPEVLPLLEEYNSDNGHIKRKSDEGFANNKRSRQ